MLSPEQERQEFQQWLAEARDGSSDALGRLLQRYQRQLLWLANHELDAEVQAKGGASDVVQQTFLRAQQGLDGFRGQTPEEFLAWLRRILLNNVDNFHRHYRRTEKRTVTREVPLPTAERAPPGAASPSSIAASDEESARLQAALARLPEDYRRVLTLRYWNRLSYQEIGKLMDRSPEATRKLWSRAVQKLVQVLEPHGERAEDPRKKAPGRSEE